MDNNDFKQTRYQLVSTEFFLDSSFYMTVQLHVVKTAANKTEMFTSDPVNNDLSVSL